MDRHFLHLAFDLCCVGPSKGYYFKRLLRLFFTCNSFWGRVLLFVVVTVTTVVIAVTIIVFAIAIFVIFKFMLFFLFIFSPNFQAVFCIVRNARNICRFLSPRRSRIFLTGNRKVIRHLIRSRLRCRSGIFSVLVSVNRVFQGVLFSQFIAMDRIK